MANEVKLTVKISDDGTLDIVAKKSKAAAKATDNLTSSSEKLSKARNRYNRGEKGVANMTSNTTKGFSKMRDSMSGGGGLVPAYATLAANVFALSAAFGVLQRAAQLEQLRVGFETLANTAGRSADIIVEKIKNITNQAVSSDAAFRSAAAGFNAGFSSIEIERLTQIAKTASQALGRDLTDSLDRLIRGTAKLEPEILDELGIFVRLDDAVKKYAQSLGKAADSLTETERRQAFLNAALTQGEVKFSAIGDSIPANPFDKLAANFDKISKTFLNIVSTVLGPVIELLANSTIALVGALIIFGKSITSQIFPVLDDLGARYRDLAEGAKRAAKEASESQSKLISSAKLELKDASPLGKKTKFAKIQLKLQRDEVLSVEELIEAKKSLMRSEQKRSTALKKYSGEQLTGKQKELDLVIQQRQAVENLIRAEKGLTGPQIKQSRAAVLESLETGVSDAVSDIQRAGALNGFSIAREKLGDYSGDVTTLARTTSPLFITGNKKVDASLKRLAINFRISGVAARLFGAALINAIPVIGQIIFVIGILFTGLKALADAVFGPSKAMKELEEVVESSSGKMEQLVKVNQTLESKYYSILTAQEMQKKSIKELTAARLEEIKATAIQFAEVEAYANQLKVTAGITNEFASAVDGLATEFKAGDIGFFGKLIALLENGTYGAISFVVNGVTSAFRGLKNILMDNVFVDMFSTIASSIAEIGGSIFPEMARAMDIAPVLGQVREFKSATLEQFENLKTSAPEVAKSIENSLNMPFAEFVDQQLAGVAAANNATAANKEFERGSLSIRGALKLAAIEANNNANAINKFAENVRESGVQLDSFRQKFFKKGEFGEMADELQKTIAAVKNLRKVTDAAGSETTFASAISRAVELGEIDLATYGVSLDDIKKKGEAAFDPLLRDLRHLDTATRNYKAEVTALKAQLAQIKGSAKLVELQFQLSDIKEGLLTTGQATQVVARGFDDLQDRRKDQLAAIEREREIRFELIDKEINLEILKLEVLKANTDATKEQKKLIEDMISNLELQRGIRKSQATTDSDTATAGVDIRTVVDADKLRSRLLSLAQTGDTTALRMAALGDQFQIMGDKGLSALDLIDENGDKIGSNFSGKAQLLVSSLQPMIDQFKQLGPEGEVVAAFASGMALMSQSVTNFADVLERAFGGQIPSSFESFKESFGEMGLQQKAAVASAAFSMAAASIAGLSQALAAQSRAAIKGIDDQIDREKKLDGKSQESKEKIKKLEAEKEKIKRKAFETDKKLKLAQAVMSVAAGVAAALTLPPPFGFIMAGLVAAMGAAQVAIISGMSYQGGGSASTSAASPTSITAGSRANTVDIAKSQSSRGEIAYMRGESGMGTGPENFRPAFSGYKNRAEGGNAAFMVGEQGPELFVPQTPGNIVPNDDIATGRPTNVTFNISAVDATGVEELLLEQRGNLIGMIREASNSYGQTFLEDIDTTVYTPQAGGVGRY